MASLALCAALHGHRRTVIQAVPFFSGYDSRGRCMNAYSARYCKESSMIQGRQVTTGRHNYAAGHPTLRSTKQQQRRIIVRAITANQSSEESLLNPSMSLEAQTDIVLNRIPVGSLTTAESNQAQKILFRWTTASQGADVAETVLERLVAEEQIQSAEIGSNSDSLVKTIMYNVVLGAWSRSSATHAASRAEQLLNRMEHRDRSDATPDVVSYNSLLNAYSQQKDTVKVEQLLSKMEHSSVRPDTTTYNIVINTYANQVGCYSSAQRAEDVLLRISELSKQNSDVQVTTQGFNTVLKAWKNSGGGIASAKRAEDILRIMIQLSKKENGYTNVRPDRISFSTVIHSYAKYAKQHGDECVKRAEEILNWMQDALEREYATNCFNAVIHLLAKSEVHDAGERATAVLDQMIQLHDSGRMICQPNAVTYASLIGAWTKSQCSDRLERGRAVLQYMMDGEAVARPNAVVFNTLIAAYCSAGMIVQAEELFEKMKDIAQDGDLNVAPDLNTYGILIDYYCKRHKTSNNGGPKRAFRLLQEIEQAYASGYKNAKPEAYLYNLVITALSKGNSASALSYDILRMMEEQHRKGNTKVCPDTITYNIVLSTYAKDPNAQSADKAMLLLQRMNKLRNDGNFAVEPDVITYTSVITAWSRSPDRRRASKHVLDLFDQMLQLDKEGSKGVRLDTLVYKLVLSVLAKSNSVEGAQAAVKVLDLMNTRYKTSGNEYAKPDSASCNLLVKAYANSGVGSEAAERAQEILMSLIQRYRRGEMNTVPDRVGFNTLIYAWAKSGRPDAVTECKKLLELMQELRADGVSNLEPNCFTSVVMLQILSTSREGRAMESTLEYFDQIDISAKDVTVYNSLLLTWARSDYSDKAKKAFDLLKQMHMDLKESGPDCTSYNTVLNACAFTKGEEKNKEEAWDIACQVFHDVLLLEKSTAVCYRPNEHTFGTMIKACKNLSNNDTDRMERIKFVFEKCCSLGMVGPLVLRELRYVLSESQRENLFGSYSSAERFPKEWSQNVTNRHSMS